jgi:hypothetical protein
MFRKVLWLEFTEEEILTNLDLKNMGIRDEISAEIQRQNLNKILDLMGLNNHPPSVHNFFCL